MCKQGTIDSHVIILNLVIINMLWQRKINFRVWHNCNKNGIPNDPRNFIETSGIRIDCRTTRGLKDLKDS